ncbi:MAG: RHS repeat-associated core domain-containing protein, partial [bacterium]
RMDLNGDGDVSQADFDLWDVAYRQARQQPTGNPAAPWMDDAPFNGVAEGGVLTVPTRSGTSATGGTWVMHGVDNRFGFAGYMWDPFLKLYHVRHRVYDPMGGRWLQRDPIGMAGGWNLYQYCGGEPWGYVDPSGLILDDFIDGMREVRDLFTGRAAEEDARWDAANSKAVGNCFKQAKKLEQEGKPEQAAQVRCICSQMQKGTLAASNQLSAIRQQQWTDIGDTARNSIVATVGVLVAPATLLGQVGFNVAGNVGLEALYGGDLRSAALDGLRDGVLGWGIGKALRGLTGGLGGVNAMGNRARWAYGKVDEGALGVTDKFGNVTIRSDLAGRELLETVRHERIHSLLSPAEGGIVADVRATAAGLAYKHSALVRFTEETIAETYATGSLFRGVTHSLSGGYGISLWGVAIEGTGYIGTLYGAGQVGYHWRSGAQR